MEISSTFKGFHSARKFLCTKMDDRSSSRLISNHSSVCASMRKFFSTSASSESSSNKWNEDGSRVDTEGGGEEKDVDDADDVAKQRAFRVVVVIIIIKGLRRSIFVWNSPPQIGFQFNAKLHYKYFSIYLSKMPPKKKKGPGRPPKKKKTTTTTPKKKTSTPEPPSSPLTTNEEFEDEHVGKRIEVEYGTGGTKRWYVGTIISSKPHKNLAMVFYEFDKQLGIIDFPKLKKDTRLVPKASRWTEKMMKVLLTKELKIKNKQDMEKEWMKQEGKRVEESDSGVEDEADEDDDDDDDDENGGAKNDDGEDVPDEVYETLSRDGRWRWPTLNELYETKMVKAGATTGREAFVLTTITFKHAYREEDDGPIAEAGAAMVSVGACVRVKEKNRLVRVDQIDEKKGTFKGVRILTRNECRHEWVGKFIDVCPKQGLKPNEIKSMSDEEANEYEIFVTEDDSGWIDISDIVEVMNARHHLAQPPKKKSLEDNVFETRVATMKFTSTGASGRRETELEAKVFRTKKVTCLSTFTSDEKTLASERKRVMDSVVALVEEESSAKKKKGATKKTPGASAEKQKKPAATSAKKKEVEVKKVVEEKVARKQSTPEPPREDKKDAVDKNKNKIAEKSPSAVGVITPTAATNGVPPEKKKGIEVIEFIVPEEQKKKQEQKAKKRVREKQEEEEEQRKQKREKNEKSALAAEASAASVVASETKTPQYKRPLIGQKSTPMPSSAGGGSGFSIPKQNTAAPTPPVVSSFQSATAPPPLPPNPATEKLREAMNQLKAEYANWPNFSFKNGRKSMFLFGPSILSHPFNPHGAKTCKQCGKVGHFQRDCPSMKFGGMKCYNCNGFGHKSADCPARGIRQQQQHQQHRQRERW